MRKKVDERIRTLIENGVKARHRSMFVVIGDKSRDQIVNLHYMLSKSVVKSRPSVLWCYKDKLELSSHKKKRAKQVKKLMQRGLLDPEKVDPFSLFVETAGITYCLYRDSERILDFEALTPNLLARTIETVEGGGLIVLLLRSLSSLTSLYTMVMDSEGLSEAERELKNLKEQLNDDFLLGKAVITFLDAILDKTLRSTVALLAARGRGKSAALGALDYDVVKSTNPDLKKATVRINIYKQHRDYSGTGRSLSLKLLQQLEEQNQISSRSAETAASGRLFKKIELSESIRYASGDPIESWLNALLCLDVATSIPTISRLPPPSECDLYYVNRDTLFSYHKDSELFLQRMIALYVASHYKNSPNDLQLMADAPAHHLFVLLGPVDESKNHLPDILCVIQAEMKLERQQILSLYMKVMKKFYKYISGILSKDARPTGSRLKDIPMEPHPISVEEDLNDAGKQVENHQVGVSFALKLHSVRQARASTLFDTNSKTQIFAFSALILLKCLSALSVNAIAGASPPAVDGART
ncbi:UNVERIFIED_CONTAM: RNA cytidine acetyltransferase 1 [Sesamum calycinum]|uniref:RNA cytidine acetyltransferase 1 n=1 Tax=Sesamum calycinum TaxID=2727403 RepID=A0AAW2SU03_9LAMI